MKNICIITGEPKSINLEIIAKSWFSLNNKIRKKIILIGDYNLIKFELKKINIKLPLNQIKSINEKDKINFLKIIHIPLKTNNYNNLSKKNITKYIASCLNRAHEMATNKLIKGFINCPVDKQNLNDRNYIPMSPSYNTIAFNTAKELVFEGLEQPSGYTEPILHKRRAEFKNS